MKKKSIRDEIVTREHLTDEISEFKKDLKEEMLDLREGIVDQVDSKMKRYKNEVLAGLDKISKELQDMREENAAGSLRFERLDDKVDDHDLPAMLAQALQAGKRITTLESATTT